MRANSMTKCEVSRAELLNRHILRTNEAGISSSVQYFIGGKHSAPEFAGTMLLVLCIAVDNQGQLLTHHAEGATERD